MCTHTFAIRGSEDMQCAFDGSDMQYARKSPAGSDVLRSTDDPTSSVAEHTYIL